MSVYSNWKYFFDSFWKFVSRNSYPIVLVLFFIWICIGIFPLTCYESDSMHVIAGCNIMYNQGLTFPPVYSYLYEMQPLVTYTVVGFKYVFPFLTCEQIYCLLSAICGALFIVERTDRGACPRRKRGIGRSFPEQRGRVGKYRCTVGENYALCFCSFGGREYDGCTFPVGGSAKST